MFHSRVFVTTVLIVLIFSLSACSTAKQGPPELEQAAKVMIYVTAPGVLARSGFAVAFPDCRPSEFITYFFSDMGSAEWPYTEEMAEANPQMREEAQSVRMPLLPKGVTLVPREPDANRSKQLVIKADDARGVLLVEGYLDPKEKPALVREWKLPKVTPSEAARLMYKSNLDMGMSPEKRK